MVLVLVAAVCVLLALADDHVSAGSKTGERYGQGGGSVAEEGTAHGRESGYGEAFGHRTHGQGGL